MVLFFKYSLYYLNKVLLLYYYLINIAVVSQVLHQFFFLLRILPTICHLLAARQRTLQILYPNPFHQLVAQIWRAFHLQHVIGNKIDFQVF